jgi:hypothetical protein
MKKSFGIIILLCFQWLNGLSQVNPYFTHLSLQDGLEFGGVNCLLQDHQGFIWIGNDESLLRYDGHQFKKFEHDPMRPNQSIASGRISTLYEDEEENLWIGTFTGGLTIFNTQTLEVKNYNQTTHPQFNGDAMGITCVAGWGKDSILVSTRAGLFLFQHQKLIKKFTVENSGLSNDFTSSIAIDRNGNLFLGTLSGLNILKKGEKKFISYKNYSEYDFIFNAELAQKNRDGKAVIDLEIDQNNHLWIDYWFPAFFKIDLTQKKSDSMKFTGLEGEKFETLPSDFQEDGDNRMWIATASGLYEYHLKTGQYYHYTIRPGDPNSIQSNELNCLMLDRNNVLWIGHREGISKLSLNKPTYTYENDAKKLGLTHIASMTKLNNGDLAIADNQTLLIVDPSWSVRSTFPLIYNMEAGELWNISSSSYQRIYLQRTKAFSFLDLNKKKEITFTKTDHFKKSPVMKVDEQGDSVVWLSRWWWDKENILKLNIPYKKVTAVNTPVKMKENRGYGVYGGINIDHEKIRFITNRGWMDVNKKTARVVHYDSSNVGGKFIHDSKHLYSNTSSEGFYEVELKTMRKKLYSRINGLPSKMINGFLKIDSTLWMTYHSGLIQFNTRDKQIRFFEGLSGNGIKTTTGNIHHIAGQNKLIFHDGEKIFGFDLAQANQKVKLTPPAITDLVINQKTIPPSQYQTKLKLGFRKSNTQISFSSFTFNQSQLVKYKYRLSGLEKDWNYTFENTVTYLDLPDGEFCFELAYTLDGQTWSSVIREFNFFVSAPWYYQWWFYFILVSLTGFVFYLTYRIRLRRIMELQGLRNNISRDLHDEVGSTLSSISLLSETLKYTLNDKETEGKKISEQIGGNAQKMLNVMDDIVWAINPKEDGLKNMIVRMREQANENTEYYNIQLNFKVTPENFQDTKLNMLLRKNIYLIFKEIINNACKHSKCKIIDVSIEINDKRLMLTISDNGIGFDPEKESKRNGLRNIKERTTAIKGKLQINSMEGSGTKFVFQIPIP